jgi:hypothetical protein
LGTNALYAFNPDGSTQHVWQVVGNVFYSSPAIGSDGVIYIGCVDVYTATNGKLYAFNQDGTTGHVWDAGAGFVSSPAIGTNGTIYIGRGDGAVFGFNPDGTTQRVWSVPISGFALLASPTIGADGTIYIGSNGNRFYAFNPNGTTALVYNVGGWIYSGSALDSNGTIVVGCRDNKVYAFAGTGAGLANSPWPKLRGDARNTGRSPLLAPPNVTVGEGTQSSYVIIAWSGLTNATSYEVWRSGVSNMAQAVMIAQTNGTSITDDIGSGLTPYYYWVKARYIIGNSCLSGGNQYIRSDTGPFAGAVDIGGGWKWLSWFGFFYDAGNGWIYHNEHHWMYAVGTTPASIWLWTPDMGWLWTSESLYPYMYRNQPSAWLWYQQGSTSPRWFNNLTTGQWESH